MVRLCRRILPKQLRTMVSCSLSTRHHQPANIFHVQKVCALEIIINQFCSTINTVWVNFHSVSRSVFQEVEVKVVEGKPRSRELFTCAWDTSEPEAVRTRWANNLIGYREISYWNLLILKSISSRARVPSTVPLGTIVPTNSFPGAHIPCLQSRWGQMRLLPNTSSDLLCWFLFQ